MAASTDQAGTAPHPGEDLPNISANTRYLGTFPLFNWNLLFWGVRSQISRGEKCGSPPSRLSQIINRLSACGRLNHQLPWSATKSKNRWCLLQCHAALHSTPTTGTAESGFRTLNIRVTTPENPSKAQPMSYLSQSSATRFENLSKILQQQTTYRTARTRLPWVSPTKHLHRALAFRVFRPMELDPRQF